MPRRSGKSPTCSAVAAKAKKIEKLLAGHFRAHWKAVKRELARGVDVAKDRARFFLASDSRASLRMARRYYTPARATKFANSSIGEIVEFCWAWFIPFQMYAHDSGSGLRELGDQLDQLVDGEYVAMTWGVLDNRPEYHDWDPSCPESIEALSFYSCPDLHPLPNLAVNYGDVYEITASGASPGSYLRICKSIAEPFLKAERVHAMAGIEQEFLENAANDGKLRPDQTWRVDFHCPEYSRSLIEADIVEVGSFYQKELKANGTTYLQRLRPRIR